MLIILVCCVNRTSWVRIWGDFLCKTNDQSHYDG